MKYTKKQTGLAAKIANDIAEGIDCGESRKQLRMAVSYFADEANHEFIKGNLAKTKLRLIEIAIGK